MSDEIQQATTAVAAESGAGAADSAIERPFGGLEDRIVALVLEGKNLAQIRAEIGFWVNRAFVRGCRAEAARRCPKYASRLAAQRAAAEARAACKAEV